VVHSQAVGDGEQALRYLAPYARDRDPERGLRVAGHGPAVAPAARSALSRLRGAPAICDL
jgi:hypothetical protein